MQQVPYVRGHATETQASDKEIQCEYVTMRVGIGTYRILHEVSLRCTTTWLMTFPFASVSGTICETVFRVARFWSNCRSLPRQPPALYTYPARTAAYSAAFFHAPRYPRRHYLNSPSYLCNDTVPPESCIRAFSLPWSTTE